MASSRVIPAKKNEKIDCIIIKMSDVMIKTSEPTRVKTLSIIDTISELAKNENEASRLTLPSPISNSQISSNNASHKSPRKISSSTKPSTGHSIVPFQNGNSSHMSPEITPSSPDLHKINDVMNKRGSAPPLNSPSMHTSKFSPRTPNFTLYEIDQKRKSFEFMSSTPTSPILRSSNKTNGTIPQSPFSGGTRSKLGSLRIIRGSSKDHTSELIQNGKQNESNENISKTSDNYKNTPTKVNGHLNGGHINKSDPKQFAVQQAKEKFTSTSSVSSLSFGGKRQPPPFVTLDSSVGGFETKNGKVQTPDWIREIFLHAKRGSLDKLVC